MENIKNEKNINKEDYDKKTKTNDYVDAVKGLKEDVRSLTMQLKHLANEGKHNEYIACLKALKETLNLIHQYDWQPQFSKYRVNDLDGSDSHYEVAMWEQNSDNEIRNHKRYELKSPENLNDDSIRKGVSYSNGEKHVMTDDEMDDFEEKFDKEMNSMKNVFKDNMRAFEDMNRSFSNFTHLLP